MRHAYGNAHIHADGNGNAHVHTYGDCHSNCYIHANSNGNGNIHSDGDCDSNVYANSDGNSNCYSNGNCDHTAADYTDATASADAAASRLALFRLGELARTNSRVPSLRWIRPPQRDDAKLIFRRRKPPHPCNLSRRSLGVERIPRFTIPEKSRNSQNFVLTFLDGFL